MLKEKRSINKRDSIFKIGFIQVKMYAVGILFIQKVALDTSFRWLLIQKRLFSLAWTAIGKVATLFWPSESPWCFCGPTSRLLAHKKGDLSGGQKQQFYLFQLNN